MCCLCSRLALFSFFSFWSLCLCIYMCVSFVCCVFISVRWFVRSFFFSLLSMTNTCNMIAMLWFITLANAWIRYLSFITKENLITFGRGIVVVHELSHSCWLFFIPFALVRIIFFPVWYQVNNLEFKIWTSLTQFDMKRKSSTVLCYGVKLHWNEFDCGIKWVLRLINVNKSSVGFLLNRLKFRCRNSEQINDSSLGCTEKVKWVKLISINFFEFWIDIFGFEVCKLWIFYWIGKLIQNNENISIYMNQVFVWRKYLCHRWMEIEKKVQNQTKNIENLSHWKDSEVICLNRLLNTR